MNEPALYDMIEHCPACLFEAEGLVKQNVHLVQWNLAKCQQWQKDNLNKQLLDKTIPNEQ